jgi:parallel beta helix pectate lyase-like protein
MSETWSLRRMSALVCGLILTGGLITAQLVDAATYYTAKTGNDANPGTAAAPFLTVNKGVRGLRPGDTLLIKSGTYAEALRNTIPGGTSWSAPVTVAAYPGHTVTLRPNAGTDIILLFAKASQHHITVDGLILDGTNISVSGIIIESGTDPAKTAHHIRIKNTEVKNTPETGIGVRKLSQFNEFINLRVHRTGLSGTGHGFYIHSSNNVIEHSRIYDNSKCGTQFFDLTGGVNHNTLRYNQVYNNGLGPDGSQACRVGVWIGAGTGTLAYNNLIWKNRGHGIMIGGGAANAQVYNNTTSGNGAYGLYINLGALSAVVKNNIVYGNSRAGIYKGVSIATLTNNLTSNPMFVDAAQANFKLQASSPAINAGVTLSAVPDDYVRVSRPRGTHYDIGAYEYTGSTSSALLIPPLNLRIIDAN